MIAAERPWTCFGGFCFVVSPLIWNSHSLCIDYLFIYICCLLNPTHDLFCSVFLLCSQESAVSIEYGVALPPIKKRRTSAGAPKKPPADDATAI